ncbi:hypothetical protein HK100_012812 [Physocladia obscura]|uniref:Mitochondrial carrier protein n=1 Tax=Physocladia obscura TaxID=109957 RepID=A0AAD5T8E2_9FUNG|nr:hypothetical protein HK100_012812 [Physocladia obscura]
MGPILLTVSVLRSVSFSVYTTMKPILHAEFSTIAIPVPKLSFLIPDSISLDISLLSRHNISLPSQLQYWWENFQAPGAAHLASSMLAGACAGSIVATMNAPLEFIKIQRQLDSKMRGSSVLVTPRTLETMVESSAGAVASGTAGGLGEGAAVAGVKNVVAAAAANIRPTSTIVHAASAGAGQQQYMHLGAWEWAKKIVRLKGYHYHLLRDFIGTGMYFGGYETLKIVLTPKGETAGSLVHMMAGGISGTFSWVFLYPIDLIKSVMQKEALQPIPKYKSAFEFVSKRFKKGGVRGFYHGLSAQLLRSFPVHSLNFLIYEAVLKWCKNL